MRITTIILIAVSVVLRHHDLEAQIPRTLSYQGVLTDSLGNPKPDGTYSFTFRLYESVSGGSSIWAEQKVLSVSRGLFSTTLGDQVIIGPSIAFDRPYWLSIQVASAPELSPRMPLTTSAYSITSARSDTARYALTAPQQPFADSARIAGTVPNNSITTSKITDGAVTSVKIATGQVVKRLNGIADGVTLSAQGGATITSSNDTIIINAGSGGGGTGVQGVQNTNNTLDVINPNGPTVTVNVKNSGITTTQLADNSVTSAKILNGTIAFADIGQNAASSGQVMKWNGAAWGAANDENGAGVFLPLSGGTLTGSITSTGSPSITMGKANFGSGNTNTGTFSFVAGQNNTASGLNSAIGGGANNIASIDRASVGGGTNNTASGLSSRVSGGEGNVASGNTSTISGGLTNNAVAQSATIGGGENNIAPAIGSTISGGSLNKARGQYSVVSGGGGAAAADSNSAIGDYSTIAGGHANLASSYSSTVSGGEGNNASSSHSTVNGGYYNTASGYISTIGGGTINTANGSRSTVGGGYNNTASGSLSTISGGTGNSASGFSSSVGGGGGNIASGLYATVSGGSTNFASDDYATVSGGYNNYARGYCAVVSGGGGTSVADSNSAIGHSSTVPGGRANVAQGDFSLAAGRRAKALYSGSFVWGDNTIGDVISDTANQFKIRATNGVNLTSAAGSTKEIRKGDYYGDNAIVAWGRVVGSTGDISTSKYGVTSAVRNSAGNYTITVNAPSSSSATLVPLANAETDSPPNSAATARFVTIDQLTVQTFSVYITNGSYVATDNDFTFIVTGR